MRGYAFILAGFILGSTTAQYVPGQRHKRQDNGTTTLLAYNNSTSSLTSSTTSSISSSSTSSSSSSSSSSSPSTATYSSTSYSLTSSLSSTTTPVTSSTTSTASPSSLSSTTSSSTTSSTTTLTTTPSPITTSKTTTVSTTTTTTNSSVSGLSPTTHGGVQSAPVRPGTSSAASSTSSPVTPTTYNSTTYVYSPSVSTTSSAPTTSSTTITYPRTNVTTSSRSTTGNNTAVSPVTPSTTASPTSYSNTTCGGQTLNVLGASLDWWFTETYTFAVSTFSVQFDSNDSVAGWTLLPATTTFDVASAVANPTCTSSLVYDTQFSDSYYSVSCFATPAPVAAATTVVSQVAFTTPNATTGTGQIPNVIVTPAPAAVTIPSSGGTFSAGTPFVYFSKYEIMSKYPTTFGNGSTGCGETTSIYNMAAPFSFEYTGADVNGELLVGADVTGDVNPAFLGIVSATSAVAGSWVAAPTVVVVVEDVLAAEAALAATIESSASALATPSATLPSYLVPVGPTSGLTSGASSFSAIAFTARIESTESYLLLPTDTTTQASPTTVDITTAVKTGVNVATGTALQAQTTGAGGSSSSLVSFVVSQSSSVVTIVVPVNPTQTVVTAAVNGQTVTGTAVGASAASTPAPGVGGLVSAINSAAQQTSAAQPTNALQVLSAAEASLSSPGSNPTVAAIVSGLGGPSSQGGGGGAPVSSGQAASAGGSATTPASVLVVAGSTVTPGGSAVTVGGNTISLAASSNVIVVNGATTSLSVSGTSAVVISAGGSQITATPQAAATGGGSSAAKQTTGVAANIPVITVGTQTITANAATQFSLGPSATLTPGGTAVVSGSTISLAAGATAIVINGVTKALSAAKTTPAPVITVGSTVFQGNAGSTFDIGGTLLTPGGVITVSGTTFSLAQDASSIVVNGKTSTLGGTASPNANLATITAPPVLTVNGQAFGPNGGSSYLVSGQTLTPGGAITISGPNGIETISLNSAANELMTIVGGTTVTSTIGGAGSVQIAAPILTIDGQTFTAMGSGATYVIDGKTLTPGGVQTVAISGATFIVSLAPQATLLMIEVEGPNGQVTATLMETLFPASPAKSTYYMTVAGGSATPGASGTSAGATSTAAPEASLQNSATSLLTTLPLSGAFMAVASFALAVWL